MTRGYAGNSISIMSWNIQGLTPQKMENKDFSEYLVSDNIDILHVCLQETWTNNDSKIEVNNYLMYYKPRPFIHKKSKGNSGRIVVFN